VRGAGARRRLYSRGVTITEFIAARVDEDERELRNDPPRGLGYADLGARTAREISAFREILAAWQEAPEGSIVRDVLGYTLGTLAGIWSEHPSYREWAAELPATSR
jgi:hypothetical protein